VLRSRKEKKKEKGPASPVEERGGQLLNKGHRYRSHYFAPKILFADRPEEGKKKKAPLRCDRLNGGERLQFYGGKSAPFMAEREGGGFISSNGGGEREWLWKGGGGTKVATIFV